MRIPHSAVGRTDVKQWKWAPTATLTSSSLVQTKGHSFLAKPISILELAAGIERNLPAHTASR